MLFPPISFVDNPIIQTNYTADPAPMVYNDTVYLYTTHDENTPEINWFTMNDWKCYSSVDMVNWTDHGTVLSLDDFNWANKDAWAGQCVERNGTFYFYVPVTKNNGETAIGVAVADSPTGTFYDPIGKPLVDHGSGNIDPTVFIDDDGQAYLYWGNPDLKYVLLNEDMISYRGEPGVVYENMTTEAFGERTGEPQAKYPTTYEEGPWLYKRNNLYYMIFAAGPIPEHIGYSTSVSPTGPWQYQGVIMPTQGGSFTNHPGVIDDYKGYSFFFYHNGSLPGGGGFNRSICIEELKYDKEGKILPMNMTKNGSPAVDHLNPYVKNKAVTIAWEEGVETEPCSQGGMNVCNINHGDSIKVKNVDFGEVGATTFIASVACDTSSNNQGGTIELRLDSKEGSMIGTLSVSDTGGWDSWKEKTTSVFHVEGVHDLYLIFKGEHENELFKVDYWKFESA